jgi:hypothetical protein
MRPRVADAEAYKTEQEAWRTWNDLHLSAEAQVNLPRSRPEANGPFRSGLHAAIRSQRRSASPCIPPISALLY